LAATGRERQENEIEDIRRRMRTLESNAKATIQNLKTDIRYEEDQLYEDLASSLRSRQFTEKVFNIQGNQCVNPSKDWKNVARDANDVIGNIIAKEVDDWEFDQRRVDGIKSRILEKFTKECQVYEDQLKEIESKSYVKISFSDCIIRIFRIIKTFIPSDCLPFIYVRIKDYNVQ
jgi:hypothetical protein